MQIFQEFIMNYHLHENGWTVIVDDLDLNTATQDDINHMARLLSTNTIVVIRGQNLTVEKELALLNMFGNPDPVFQEGDEHFYNCRVDEQGIICRVTAELNDNGKPGIGADPGDFDWHANMTWRERRRPLVWLYGVKGTDGSRTSYTNNIMSYNDLSPEMKETVKDMRQLIRGGIRHDGAKPSSWANDAEVDFPLVYTNQANVTGLYFPHLHSEEFLGMNEEESATFRDQLSAHTMQDKYIYNHDWIDGDVVIADQWFGLHKRWFYKDLSKRLLHRAAIEYPPQDYK